MNALKVRTTISGSVPADTVEEAISKGGKQKAGDCGCHDCQEKRAGSRKAG